MPFDLNNVGVTYRKLVNKMFENQIGRNMKVYVDDMMVKIKCAINHIFNLEKVFSIIKTYKIWLNSKKCVVGVTSGNFLGYLVSSRG